jgi:predicted small lipoprotein YifL
MTHSITRALAILLTAMTLAACGAATGPAGQPSSTNVNPETGSRGGSGASSSSGRS